MAETPNGWRDANRANWDERVPLHIGARSYDMTSHRAGRGRLQPIEEAELGSVDGLKVLHLQCHFGRDTLALAQRGASAVGVDFSGEAIKVAGTLAAELGLRDKVRFIQADVYDTPRLLAEPASFDLVYVTWGTICWLPDIDGWAKVIGHFLKPGGTLYFADCHPFARVFATTADAPIGKPGWYWPYFETAAEVQHEPRDYTGDEPRLMNAPIYEWQHPLGRIINALAEAGLTIEWLHEHDCLPWPCFNVLKQGDDGLWCWPDKVWLPLSVSLKARRQ